MSTCTIGIVNGVNKYTENKPYLRFNQKDFIKIVNSPGDRVNYNNYYSVAARTADALNKMINSSLPIGPVFYPRKYSDVTGVLIAPTEKQLALLNAEEQKEIDEAIAALEKNPPLPDILDIENSPTFGVDAFGDSDTSNLFFQNNVNFSLKSVNILSSEKAQSVFEKGQKNKWNLEKILIELQIPKQQIDLILQSGKTNREEIITDLLANYSYTVEINTAKEIKRDIVTGGIHEHNGKYYKTEDDGSQEISKQEYDSLKKDLEVNYATPTSYYSNLTVPGGTNYTENEIATPAIIPSIKGHAQFSTSNGIGWFRSDDKQPFTGFLEDLIASGTIKKVPCG